MDFDFGNDLWDASLDILPFAGFDDQIDSLYDSRPLRQQEDADQTMSFAGLATVNPSSARIMQSVSDIDVSPPIKTRKSKAQILRDCDWEPFRDLLVDLHIRQDQTLTEVKAYMEREHAFVAECAICPLWALQGS